MLVCRKTEVDGLNVMHFSEYEKYNFSHDPAGNRYFVRFIRGSIRAVPEILNALCRKKN